LMRMYLFTVQNGVKMRSKQLRNGIFFFRASAKVR